MFKMCGKIAFADFAYEPKALSKWSNRQACDGEIKVGHGIQRLPRVCRHLHEPPGKFWVVCTGDIYEK